MAVNHKKAIGKRVINAFLTAPKLAQFLAKLTNGPAVVAAHSLGNVVVLSALSDWCAPIDKYFMLDAAMAIKAIDGAAMPVAHMTHSDWVDPRTTRPGSMPASGGPCFRCRIIAAH